MRGGERAGERGASHVTVCVSETVFVWLRGVGVLALGSQGKNKRKLCLHAHSVVVRAACSPFHLERLDLYLRICGV